MVEVRLKLLANNVHWTTLDEQIKLLRERIFQGSGQKLSLHIDVEHCSFDNIPYESYAPALNGVTRDWFKRNILPKAKGYDIALLLIDLSVWQGSTGISGYAYAGEGGLREVQVTAGEYQTTAYPGTEPLPMFVAFAEHELDHTFLQMIGQEDITHEYIAQGKFNEILSVIDYEKLALKISKRQT